MNDSKGRTSVRFPLKRRSGRSVGKPGVLEQQEWTIRRNNRSVSSGRLQEWAGKRRKQVRMNNEINNGESTKNSSALHQKETP